MTTGHPSVDRENARLTETSEESESQPIWHISWKQNRDLPIQLRPDSWCPASADVADSRLMCRHPGAFSVIMAGPAAGMRRQMIVS